MKGKRGQEGGKKGAIPDSQGVSATDRGNCGVPGGARCELRNCGMQEGAGTGNGVQRRRRESGNRPKAGYIDQNETGEYR